MSLSRRNERLARENKTLERENGLLKRRIKKFEMLASESNKYQSENALLMQRVAELESVLKDKSETEDAVTELMKPENRAGVGPYLGRVNHIALIVSDVGRSVEFYTTVLGLPQIKRPNFDRHGAWFTFGNVELHLIKGQPIVHDGTNLIVGHISVESDDIEKVHQKLMELGIKFEQNVSVPSTQKSDKGLEDKSRVVSNDSKKMAMGAVSQYFFRDPDGYYIELCNCEVLTKFCFSKSPFTMDYIEGVMNPLKTLATGVKALHDWMNQAQGEKKTVDLQDIFKTLDKDGSGFLDVRDLSQMLEDIGHADLAIIDKLINEVDENEDHMISFKEFEDLLSQGAENTERELRQAFQIFDKDNSNCISAAELRHVLTQFNLHLKDEEIDKLIDIADRNGDGQVDINEFLSLFGEQKLTDEQTTSANILKNLERRRGVYGDIVQSVESTDELKSLLLKFEDNVPDLIKYLEEKYKHDRVFVPPAYLKDDGVRFEPAPIHVKDLPSLDEENKAEVCSPGNAEDDYISRYETEL